MTRKSKNLNKIITYRGNILPAVAEGNMYDTLFENWNLLFLDFVYQIF